ncbi:MAG: xanthine dehydrogenase family protein molybdopterin-binding subunit, partial [Acidimicrobiia bacterium]
MHDLPYFEPRSHLRLEDHRLITGSGRYVADLAPPETVHLAFVRSTEAHALITGIDTSSADSPDIVGVFTAADLGLQDIPGDSVAVPAPDFPRPHLASERVRYVGEPVAVVAATSTAAAVDGAELVWVDYDPLPAVVDPRKSLEDEVVLHDGAGTNVVHRSELNVGEPEDSYE